MNRQTSLKPILCIDLKKNRIRIHKQTLRLLGNPEYIQLLVNPDIHMIAIRRSVRQDYLAHYVTPHYVDNKNSYELYSQELLSNLKQINSGFSGHSSYRIYGTMNEKEGLAFFRMTECVPVAETASMGAANE